MEDLRGLQDFFPIMINNLSYEDICSLKASCKTFAELIKKEEGIVAKQLVKFITNLHNDIVCNLSPFFKEWSAQIIDKAIGLTLDKYLGNNIPHLKGIGSLLKRHKNGQNWLGPFFESVKSQSKVLECVTSLEITIQEFKLLTCFASMEIFQTKQAICIPPYFGKILFKFKKLSCNNAYDNWINSKTEYSIDSKVILRNAIIFFKNLKNSNFRKPQKLQKYVYYYKDVIYGLSNIDILFSEEISDTIYYELIDSVICKNPWTKNIYVKFTPFF